MNQHDRGRAIRRASDLTWREKVILCEINDIQGDDDCAWPAQSTIADDLGIDARHVRRALSKCAALGWLSRGYDNRGRHTYSVQVPQSTEGQNSPAESPKAEGQNSPNRAKTARAKTARGGAKTALSAGPKQPGGGGPKQPPMERPINAHERPRSPSEVSAGVSEPTVGEQIRDLESRYPTDLCADAREGIALCRRNGKVADSVWLKTLERLAKLPGDASTRAMQIYVSRYADGERDERYLVGIARREAKGKRGAVQMPLSAAAYGLTPVSSADEHERDAARPLPAWMTRQRETANA